MANPVRHRRTRYSWLRLAPGARWPRGKQGQRLLRRLNRVGRRTGRLVRIDSGRRTPYEAWAAYQDFLRGGNLAAFCCFRHYLHSWAECGKTPSSNHCINRAADCSIQRHRDDSSGFTSIGNVQVARDAMDAVGLCLPVGSGEVWHVEVGETWRS